MLYSSLTGGFYDPAIHATGIPADAVEVTDEKYQELLAGQSAGFSISSTADGQPILVSYPIDTSHERYARDIAARRYQAEAAGITVNGMALSTDRDSQALLTSAALAAVIDPAYKCQWKTVGGFVDLDAQQIVSLASAMRAHVQACFDREAALLDALEAGTYTDDLLDQGWPS